MNSRRTRAPRGSVVFRAAQLGRISVAFAEAAAYQQWVQDQEDINAAEVAIGVSVAGITDKTQNGWVQRWRLATTSRNQEEPTWVRHARTSRQHKTHRFDGSIIPENH